MFEGFANVWTPVIPARALGKKQISVRLAGEPIVLFRDGRGGVGALIDRCPHRGVALSLGRVNEAGCIECPFHGWSFATDGACATIPLNTVAPEKRARYAATGLPAREIGGLIWVFTGVDARGVEPAVPPAMIDEGWSAWIYDEVWDCHWTRAMENMLDVPHLPFLHRRTIGRSMRARLRPDSVMHLQTEPTEHGMLLSSEIEGMVSKNLVEWRRPNAMVLNISPSPTKGLRMHVYCVPVDAGHTRMVVVACRNFMRNNPIGWLANQYNRFILFEDRSVVSSSQPVEVPPPGDELSVATDAPTLQFRRYYFRELRPSPASATSPASAASATSATSQASATSPASPT